MAKYTLEPIDDRCQDCQTARATFQLLADGAVVGRYCQKDATGALKRGGGPKPERKEKK